MKFLNVEGGRAPIRPVLTFSPLIFRPIINFKNPYRAVIFTEVSDRSPALRWAFEMPSQCHRVSNKIC